MLNLKTRGFTIVELLIVIVVIGLLALLVLNNVGGATAEARDAQRETDIQAVHSQLEVYQAKNGWYPTTANLSDATFVDTELEGLDAEALNDPNGVAINGAGGNYSYAAAPAGCDNDPAVGGLCTSYTLDADLEDGTTFSKNSLLN